MTQVTRLTLDEDGGLDHRRIHLREISDDIDMPLETVGQDLRAARHQRGLDLAEASKALKIRKEHLEALEEDRLEALPGRAYAVGFVRSYANYLGLDPVLYVDRFKAEIAGRDDVSAPKVEVIEEDEQKKLPQGLWIVAIVVLLVVIYGAFQLMEKADDALRVNEAPAEDMSVPTPKPPVRPAQQANTAAPTLGLTTAPAAGAKTMLGEAGAKAAAPEPDLPQGREMGLQNKKDAHVMLRALAPVRVLVESPVGRWYINRTLRPGDIYYVPDIEDLKLTVSNASAVEISLDGQRIGPVGRGSESVEAMPLDPQSIRDRYGHFGQGL